MRKLIVATFLLFTINFLYAQRTYSLSPLIRTLKVLINDDWKNPPIITLGSDDEIEISFDELSHNYHRFIYNIEHCNADWTPSDLYFSDYIDGFSDRSIENFSNSINTLQLYTNYSLTIPNGDVKFKISGNYKLSIYDCDDTESPLAIVCFSVLNPKVKVFGNISGNTDIDTNKSHQQLNFTVSHNSYSILNPSTDIKPVIYQNNRLDNAVSDIKPTYIKGNAFEYVHNDKLIFKAGNEYRRFEITNQYSPGYNVDIVNKYDDFYHATLYEDKQKLTYTNDRDQNGHFFINSTKGNNSNVEAEYVYIHFTLNVPFREGGNYYLIGELNGNDIDDSYKLFFDNDEEVYMTSLFLKLGMYNYRYIWVSDGSFDNSYYSVDGDFYYTENEYLVLIYHRSFGSRYDELIGYSKLKYDLLRN